MLTWDGGIVAMGLSDGYEQVFDVTKRAIVAEKTVTVDGGVFQVAVASQEGRTVGGTEHGEIVVWNFRTRATLGRIKVTRHWIDGLAISPDGALVLARAGPRWWEIILP